MIDIVICDYYVEQRNEYEKIINEEIRNKKLEMQIALSTRDVNEVIKYVEDNNDKKILYFLDVELESDVNGLELARYIRKYDNKCCIAFITISAELCSLTFKYKVQAMDYIVKGNTREVENRIKECLYVARKKFENINKSNEDKEKSIVIKSGKTFLNFKPKDIIYIETSENHRITIHSAQNRQIDFYGTMKELAEVLPEEFCRVHRSYIVNIKAIKEIDKNKKNIFLSNNKEVSVSRYYLDEVIEKYK